MVYFSYARESSCLSVLLIGLGHLRSTNLHEFAYNRQICSSAPRRRQKPVRSTAAVVEVEGKLHECTHWGREVVQGLSNLTSPPSIPDWRHWSAFCTVSQ